MKKIAISQPNYIPWKGVFDLINQVDVFVFLEDVQYTKADWRSRNKIITDNGTKWLSVPVNSKGKYHQMIYEAEICRKTDWQQQHFNLFRRYYRKAKYFYDYEWLLEDFYKAKSWNHISDFNMYSTKTIANLLNIKTEFISSLTLNCSGTKDDKLISICKKAGADYYLSGPAARNYIIPEKFEKENIQLKYMQYIYPDYEQVFQPFDHYVTVLDLIFNCGENAAYYIWGWRG